MVGYNISYVSRYRHHVFQLPKRILKTLLKISSPSKLVTPLTRRPLSIDFIVEDISIFIVLLAEILSFFFVIIN